MAAKIPSNRTSHQGKIAASRCTCVVILASRVSSVYANLRYMTTILLRIATAGLVVFPYTRIPLCIAIRTQNVVFVTRG